MWLSWWLTECDAFLVCPAGAANPMDVGVDVAGGRHLNHLHITYDTNDEMH